MQSMTKRRSHRRSRASAVPATALALAFGLMACSQSEPYEGMDAEGTPIGGPDAPSPSPGAPPPAAATPPSTPPVSGGGGVAPPTTPPPVERAIPAGTELVFEVTETVSTSSHQEGQAFSLRLLNNVSGVGGAAIPAGAAARGVVTESHPSTGPDDQALLVVDIRSVQVAGATHTVRGTVVSATTETSTQASTQRTAATIAVGAAAGAVIGQILGRDTRSTVAGAAAGAVAGTAVALSTRDGHASLPAGSQVRIRLSEAMTLP